MSLGESDAKFPNQSLPAIPPSPSRENPAQVYPKSDPNSAPPSSLPGTGQPQGSHPVIGNPFLLDSAFKKLEQSLGGVIAVIEREAESVGESSDQAGLLATFKTWRTELEKLQHGSMGRGPRGVPDGPSEGQGLFAE